MIKKVDQTSVADIFSINSDRVYRIPKYQREYTWRTRDWDERVKEIKAENPNTDDISALFFIKSQFEQAILVGIEVDTNKDAYMLFESLNKRGVPLSAIDLIKNTLIATADNESDADDAYEKWKQILNNIAPDDYSVQERFFRQYYNAFREELNKPFNDSDKKYHFGYLATRTTLLDIYEKMIKNNYRALLDDLFVKSQKYALIVNNSDEEHTYTSALMNLERISGAPSYLLLLYILSNQEELNISDDDILQITQNAILVPNLKEIFKELENLNIDKTAPCCQT